MEVISSVGTISSSRASLAVLYSLFYALDDVLALLNSDVDRLRASTDADTDAAGANEEFKVLYATSNYRFSGYSDSFLSILILIYAIYPFRPVLNDINV